MSAEANELGNRLRKEGRFDEARRAYVRAIEADDTNTSAWCNLGLLFATIEETQKAEKCFQAAIEIDPEHGCVWHTYGNYLASVSRYAEADEAFQRAVQLEPENAELWAAVDNLHSEKDWSQAEGAFQRVLELNPEKPRVLMLLGFGQIRNNMTDAGIESLRKALELNPEMAEAWVVLSKVLVERGHLREAIDTHYEAVKL